ncbi:MAG: DinB family protein [Candidatus Dormibacteraeota bacterium]|nr:DinB family protein [Candidatus Dormibacteraeota bacterium]MBV9525754.1 DinB family protein [Candidatus Dormibacteraeota bacterium]
MDFSLERSREVLRSTPQVLDALLTDASDDWVMRDEGPATWSPWQVVGHMTHIEETDWIDRTRMILEHGTERPFEPVDREAGFTRFAGWSVQDLLSRFASLRAANLKELESLVGEGELSRRGVHPAFGEVTLSQLLATWTVHDLNHIGQIVKTMAKQYGSAVGPWREFLPIIDA